MSKDTLYFETNGFEKLRSFLFSKTNDQSLFVLVDENTHRDCLPLVLPLLQSFALQGICTILAGEEHKNFHSLSVILQFLTEKEADRNALLINLGGGVVTDIGGFAASIYKRGIAYINIPTTLLAQIDASIGGKTAIDFMGLKNQIGTFYSPSATFISEQFLATLAAREIQSGFAEALKHALIADHTYWNELKRFNGTNYLHLTERSVAIKSAIVTEDPFEKNIRKKLNFGHTIGHAVESFSLEKDKKPLLHGEAIVIGMICESYLSWQKKLIEKSIFDEIIDTLQQFYTKFELPITDIQNIVKRMYHDKKNSNSQLNFTLLNAIGTSSINHICDEDLVISSLQFYSTL